MYSHPYENLEYPAHDAEQVARVLEQHGQFEVERLPKRLNPDTGRDEVVQKELTGDELGEALNQFLLEKAKGSDALIYYSGHGITVPNKVGRNKGYLVTSDCASGTVWRDGIALDDFNDLISEADLKSLVVLLDCCHAGYFLESNLIRQTLSIFSRKTDCFLIAACRSNEKSYEGGSYGGEHGVFTNALLEGLSQENAGYDGKIRTDELFSFISRKLELRNKNKPLKPQEAIRISSGCSLTLVSYPPKPTPPLPDDTCPYQGLQFFDKKQARFFFGRRKVIETLRQKLEQANFVPVIGASGSGKSSVVRAGLIPGLEENGWRVLNPILPGSEPLEKLKQAFSQLVEQPEDVQTIASLIDTALNLQPGTGEDAKDTRQRQPKQKLLALAGDKEANQKALCPVLDRLINERLLVAGEEGWIDLAHETLMEDWQRFAQWRQEKRQLRRLIDRVEDALRIWQEEKKDDNLMMGGLLDQVREKWLELEPILDSAAREFYQQSDALEKQKQTAETFYKIYLSQHYA
jgi:hypothetical protein